MPPSRISTCSPRRARSREFFDTQVAGGFLGYGTPSLVAILNGELGVNLRKAIA